MPTRSWIEVPSQCPDSSKVGTSRSNSESLRRRRSPARIYFGEPKPGNQYRLCMFADGFGIHAKLIGKLLPDPKTGRLTDRIRGSAAAAVRQVRNPPVRLRSRRPRDPDRLLASTRSRPTSIPGTTCSPTRTRASGSTSPKARTARPVPAQARPFNPRLNAGTSNSKAGAFSDFTLKLDRDDGDQFLGDLGFTMPPGLTGSLRGIRLLP